MKKGTTAKHHKKQKISKPVQVPVAKRVLGKAPQELGFVLADGRRLHTLYDLVHALQDMNDDVFQHHVNEERNDFSNWVNDVFEEPELAAQLRTINNKLDAELLLLRSLARSLQHKK